MPVSQARVRAIFHEVCKQAAAHPRIAEDIRDSGWTFSFNNRKKALGLCSYRHKSIQISQHYAAHHSEEDVRNTMSHEVAHAIAGGREGHGAFWKLTHRRLGGDGMRCGSSNIPHAWEVINTLNNKVVAKYHRKPRRDFSQCTVKGNPATLGKLVLRRAAA